jgi:hypothetical protein
VLLIKFTSRVLLVTLLGCAVLFGRSASPVTPLLTFHIDGTIQDYDGVPASGAEVTFQSDKTSKTVNADDRGFYEAVLPVGLYTMTTLYTGSTQNPSVPLLGKARRFTKKYQHPLFRVSSRTKVTLNVTFETEMSCDPPFRKGHMATPKDFQHICGGTELFSIPSDDNIPFQLSIRYQGWRRDDQGFTYSDLKIPMFHDPVFVVYNLFTLRADKVVYDVKNQTLEATGNVLAGSSDGTAHHADSMIFKIENGEATLLH